MKRSFRSREYIEDDEEDDSAITDVREYYLEEWSMSFSILWFNRIAETVKNHLLLKNLQVLQNQKNVNNEGSERKGKKK